MTLLHVDLDAFFASVEQLLRPELRGRPVIVGGTGARGVVAAASYEARRYGVHSAMPTAMARRACPGGVFLSPRMDLYQDHSRRVFAIFHSVTPKVEPVSIDEAFLDVAGARRLFGDGPDIAALLKARVKDETGLTCSIGVASTKLVAKLASDASKPDGLLVVPPGSELDFLHPLPVERLWGVGPATRQRLERLGVRTVGELAAVPVTTLERTLGRAAGQHLHALAWNRDDRTVTVGRRAKSISAEETFAIDLTAGDDLRRELRNLAVRVGVRLRRASLAGRTVTVKLRYPDFRTVTRSETAPELLDRDADIARVASGLLERIDVGPGVRLLGVGVSGLEAPAGRQDPLPFEPRLDATVDAIRDRFGLGALGPATRHAWGPDDDAGPEERS